MHVSIHHIITDQQKWDQVTKNLMAAVEQGRLPQGLKPLMYLPGTDGRKADCLWEAQSLDALKNFLNPQIGTAASNDYFQIKSEAAFGLPGQEEMRKAA
jgi:DNA polymerase/3'-5' exonuclease PolX